MIPPQPERKLWIRQILTLPRRGQGSLAVVNGRSKMTQGGSSLVKYCKYIYHDRAKHLKKEHENGLANWGCWVWEMASDSGEIRAITIINDNSRSWVCIFILFNPFSSRWLSNDLKRSRAPGAALRPGRTPGAVTSRGAPWGRGWSRPAGAAAGQPSAVPGQGPQVPEQAPPLTTRPREKPRPRAPRRTRAAPAAPGEKAPLQTDGNTERLRDPRPATSAPLTHRPSSCSASFTLKLKPQHPTLPAPSLTHFPAEPAPSITPAPPPPPRARPGPGAEGACGSCRRDRGKAARGGGRHSRCRAAHCGRCSSAP